MKLQTLLHHLAFVLPLALLVTSFGFRLAGSPAADHLLFAGLCGCAIAVIGRTAWLIAYPGSVAMWRFVVDANVLLYFAVSAVLTGALAIAAAGAGSALVLLAGSLLPSEATGSGHARLAEEAL